MKRARLLSTGVRVTLAVCGILIAGVSSCMWMVLRAFPEGTTTVTPIIETLSPDSAWMARVEETDYEPGWGGGGVTIASVKLA